MEQKFYICAHCGNIIAKVHDSGVPVMCCGQKMSILYSMMYPNFESAYATLLAMQ